MIGTRPIRPDGTDKVIGRALYGIDTRLPRMLHARVLRSPHARIKAIDASRALALPGVMAVVTAAELPQPSGKVADLGEGAMINPRFMSNNILASDKVLYKGHAVAAVAATSRHLADEAVALIEVEYEVLPVVLDGERPCSPMPLSCTNTSCHWRTRISDPVACAMRTTPVRE